MVKKIPPSTKYIFFMRRLLERKEKIRVFNPLRGAGDA